MGLLWEPSPMSPRCVVCWYHMVACSHLYNVSLTLYLTVALSRCTKCCLLNSRPTIWLTPTNSCPAGNDLTAMHALIRPCSTPPACDEQLP